MQKRIDNFFSMANKRSDKMMDYFLATYFGIGLLLALQYDTWLIGSGVGALCLLAYYSVKLFLPGSNLYQYVLGAIAGVFMAQFVYQMHGLFEMHFFAFIGSVILITYRNWKLQVPLAVVVLLHHAAFGYLQFTGFDKIYFTQLEYMSLQTFIIHISLAIAIFCVSGFWAYNFKRNGENYIIQSFKIGELTEAGRQQEEIIKMAEELRISNEQLGSLNRELETISQSVEEVLFSRNMINHQFIHISNACKKVFGYSSAELLEQPGMWKTIVHPEDLALVKQLMETMEQGKASTGQYRIIHKSQRVHWIQIKMIPTLNKQLQLVRIDGICKDITQEKELENKLANERAKRQQQVTTAVITAQENERCFLGQELHDNINPILATAKLYIDCVLGDRPDSRELLLDSKSFISTAMNEIRTLSKSLVPPSLGEVGLTAALWDMVAHIKAVHNIEINCEWNELDEHLLQDKLKLTIYRIVQEQLNNILKHAHANKVQIMLSQAGFFTTLQISDDGVGFDAGQKRNGVGLQNIISRTELFEGTVSIDTAPGKGCKITAQFCSPSIGIEKGYKTN